MSKTLEERHVWLRRAHTTIACHLFHDNARTGGVNVGVNRWTMPGANAPIVYGIQIFPYQEEFLEYYVFPLVACVIDEDRSVKREAFRLAQEVMTALRHAGVHVSPPFPEPCFYEPEDTDRCLADLHQRLAELGYDGDPREAPPDLFLQL